MKPIYIVLLLLLFGSYCNGQNEASTALQPKIIATKVNTDYGPTEGTVNGGLQDKDGNIWFTTSVHGIYRFDGKLFANYTIMDGMPVNSVTDIVEDNEGSIWFGTDGGAVRYQPSAAHNTGRSFTAVRIPVDDDHISAGFMTNSNHAPQSKRVHLFKDGSGNIWFYTGIDFYRYDERTQSAYLTGIGNFLSNGPSADDNARRGVFNNAYTDRNGNTWLTTGACCCFNETYRLNGADVNNLCLTNRCKHDLNNPRDLAAHKKEIAASFTKIRTKSHNSFTFTAALEDKSGNIWFGTWDSGLYRFDGSNFVRFSNKKDLTSGYVGSIFEDKSGGLWFSSGRNADIGKGNGVYCYNGKSLIKYSAKDGLCNKGALSDNSVSCITEDKTGKLWFGGNGGVSCFNGKSFTSFSEQDGLSNDQITCIVKDRGGNLWFGGHNLGLSRYHAKGSVGSAHLFTSFTDNKPNR